MERIDYLVVHCSDTPNGRETHAKDMHRWHLEQGWDGIGYHAVITLKGEVEWGRPKYWQGAHADPFNSASLGICMIGRDEFNNAQFRALEGLLLSLKLSHPKAIVVGHRDLNPHKTCPNFDVKAWWLDVERKGLD